jgi:hypothetical protein
MPMLGVCDDGKNRPGQDGRSGYHHHFQTETHLMHSGCPPNGKSPVRLHIRGTFPEFFTALLIWMTKAMKIFAFSLGQKDTRQQEEELVGG